MKIFMRPAITLMALFLGIPWNWAMATDNTGEMIRLLTSHVALAREIDGPYRAAVASKEAALQALEYASAALGVKVSASATSFYTDRTEQSVGASGSTELHRNFGSSQVYLTAKKPLYRKRDTLTVEQAEAQHRRMQAITHQTKIRLSAQAIQAYSKVGTSLLKIDAAKTYLDATGLRAESLRRGFLAGVATRGELGRAETDFHEARQRRTKEIADFVNFWVTFTTTVAQIDTVFQPTTSQENRPHFQSEASAQTENSLKNAVDIN